MIIGIDLYNLSITWEVTKTLNIGTDSDHIPCVCYTLDEKMGGTYVHEDLANTLAARDYKQPQLVCYGFDPGATRDIGIAFYEECSKTLTNGTCPGHHQWVVIHEDTDREKIL